MNSLDDIPGKKDEPKAIEKSDNEVYLEKNKCYLKLFDCYIGKVVNRGNNEPFQINKLYEVPEQYQIEKGFLSFLSYYQLQKGQKSLWKICRSSICDKQLGGCIYFLIGYAQLFLTIPLLYQYYNWIKLNKKEDNFGWIWVLSIMGLFILKSICNQMGRLRIGKAAVINEMNIQSLLQWKIIKLTSTYRFNIKPSKFIDLFQDDLKPLNEVISNWYEVPAFLLLLIASTHQIYNKLDCIAFQLPISYQFLSIILGYFKKAIISAYRNHLQLYDIRITKLEDMLKGIVLIKTNAWELVMEHFVNKKRSEDKQVLKGYNISIGFTESLLTLFPFGVLFAMLCIYIENTEKVDLHVSDAYEIFFYIIVLNEPYKRAFYFMRNYAVSKDLFLRLSHFMSLEEYAPLKNDEGVSQGEILFKDAYFGWENAESKKNNTMMNNLVRDHDFFISTEFIQSPPKTQVNVNLHIKPRSQNGIIGLQGSGKTSLLNAICDEMVHYGGDLKRSGNIGIVTREPFQLTGSTIRFNIIFGHEYNPMRYDRVIYACELKGVFRKFPLGDFSKVGDKNVYLDQSIVQRMMLARAVYSDPDIYLIDNIWDIFDKKMAKKIWDKLIIGYQESKTRLCVSNDILSLAHFDNIILMNQGTVEYSDCLDKIKDKDCYFNFQRSAKDIRIFDTKVVKDIQDFYVNIEEAENMIKEVNELGRLNLFSDEKKEQMTKVKSQVQTLIDGHKANEGSGSDSPIFRSRLFKIDGSLVVSIDELDLKQQNPEFDSSFYEGIKKQEKPLVQKQPQNPAQQKKMYQSSLQHFCDVEMEVKGEEEFVRRRNKQKFEYHENTQFSIWCEFLREGGWCFLLYLSYFGVLGSMMTCTYTIGEWLEAASSPNHVHERLYKQIYIIALINLSIMLAFRTFGHAQNYSNASNQIHGKLLYNLLRRPIQWFSKDSNNEVSQEFKNDLENIDMYLPYYLQSAIYYWLCTLSAFILCQTLMPLSINQLVGLFILYIVYFNRMLKNTVELRHLKVKNFVDVKKSLKQFLIGGTQLRIYNFLDHKQKIFDRFLNNHIRISLHEKYVYASITFNMELVSGLFLFVFQGFAGCARYTSLNLTQDSSIICAALAWCFYSMQFVMTMVMQSDCIIDMMKSVEYVRDWILDNDLEAEWVMPKAPANWPSDGYVIARTQNVRYEKTEARALCNVSFKVAGGNKVGIIGRTGSGKTTLLNCFLRTVENEKDSFGSPLGNLFIDSHKQDDICLHGIRRKIMLIPQDLNLLNGNQIFNIDPLMQYSDEEILSALKKAKVWDLFYNSMREAKKLNQHENVPYKSISTNTQRLSLLRQADQTLIGEIPTDLCYQKMGLPNADSMQYIVNQQSQEGESKVLESTDQMNFEEKEFDKKILTFKVEKQGGNLSIRERQLIYQAKAILVKPKILLVDEMTYDLDPDTWTVFHEIIDKEFKGCTMQHVLTKLNNLRSYDKVIMLDKGEVIENGEPNRLLNDSESFLYKLVGEFGKDFDTMDVDLQTRALTEDKDEIKTSLTREIGELKPGFNNDMLRKNDVDISSDDTIEVKKKKELVKEQGKFEIV